MVYSVGADVLIDGAAGQPGGEHAGSQELQRGKTSRELAEPARAFTALRNAPANRQVLF
jgi:hypothetical protein